MTSLNALVSYGDSDEDSGSDQEPPVNPVPSKQATKRAFLAEADSFGSALPKASSVLPSFKPDASGKVKIFVPKVEDDDGIPSKKSAPISEDNGQPKQRCALFSVLPPPRINPSLIPPSVAGRRRAIVTEDVEWGAKARPAPTSQPVHDPAKVATSADKPKQLSPIGRQNDSSSDEEGGGPQNFFSINETAFIPPSKITGVFDYGTEIGPAKPKSATQSGANSNEFTGIFGPVKPSAADFKHIRIDVVEGHKHDHEDDIEPDEDDDYDNEEPTEAGYREWLAGQEGKLSQEGCGPSSSLDMEELRKMQGRHNKGEAINIIDCKADDLLDPAEYARQKAIEEAKASISGPNTMAQPRGRAKSRHQITYLAWLAKERETELKEFWAQSKMNKNQAKLKYGF